jgi:hypothetical protein
MSRNARGRPDVVVDGTPRGGPRTPPGGLACGPDVVERLRGLGYETARAGPVALQMVGGQEHQGIEPGQSNRPRHEAIAAKLASPQEPSRPATGGGQAEQRTSVVAEAGVSLVLLSRFTRARFGFRKSAAKSFALRLQYGPRMIWSSVVVGTGWWTSPRLVDTELTV